MNPQMPTIVGDIIIDHAESMRTAYTLWLVTRDGQQAPDPSAATSTAIGRDPAMSLARKMAAENGGAAIYMRDLDTLSWTKLSD